MDAVVQQVGDKVVFVDVQLASSDYGSESGDEVSDEIVKQNYVPAFWMIDEVVDNGDVSSNSKAVSYATNAYNSLESEGVTANITFEFEIARDKLTVNSLTKFFKQTSGDYYVNIMLLESDFQVNQNGAGMIDAQRVLRVLFSGENGDGDAQFWGTQVGSGEIAAGTEVAKTFSTTLNSSWVQDNFTIVTTIWKKSGNTVKAISVDDVPGDVTPVINNPVQLSAQSRFTFHNKGNAGVTFTNLKEGNVKLYIYDMAGRVISRPLDAWFTTGNHTVAVRTPELAAGVYNYRLVTPDKVVTEKFVVSHK